MKEDYEGYVDRPSVLLQGEWKEIKNKFYVGSVICCIACEIEEKKQAAADVLFQYSKFVMACIGNQVRPCDLRLHLMKEVSGMPTFLKKDSSHITTPPDVMGESSGSGTSRIDKTDSFRAL